MTRKQWTLTLSLTIPLFLLSCMANPHFVGGKNYVNQQVWDKAAAELEIAVQQQPSNAEAWYNLGIASGELGRKEGTEEHFRRAGEAFARTRELSDKFDAEADQKVQYFWEDLAARGQDLEAGGRYEEAARRFENGLLLKPEHVASYSYLAQLYSKMGDVERAAAKYEAALELRPDNDTTITNYAKFLEDSGLEDRAIPLFERLLESRPEDENILYHLADLYWKTGEQAKAIEIFTRMKDPTVLMNLGYDADAAEDYEESLRYYEMARDVAEHGSDAYFDAFYNAIVAAYKQQNYDKAIELGEKLVEERPDDPRNWRILGNSYARARMGEKSLRAFERAQELEGKR
ncbi:MAG: tetratricopeptide repeat protein [Candidatus Eisenbacteria bacterium]